MSDTSDDEQRERTEGGQYARTVTDENVLDALTTVHDEYPVATTGDVADLLDVSTEPVRRRLHDLHDEGRVERRKVGARAVVWWLPSSNGG